MRASEVMAERVTLTDDLRRVDRDLSASIGRQDLDNALSAMSRREVLCKKLTKVGFTAWNHPLDIDEGPML